MIVKHIVYNCRRGFSGQHMPTGKYMRIHYQGSFTDESITSIDELGYRHTQITIRISTNEYKFPIYTTGGRGYLSCLLLTPQEALVNVIAHELRHAWQEKHKRGRVWGARGEQSELDCDAYAIRKVRQWRRKNMKTFGLGDWESIVTS